MFHRKPSRCPRFRRGDYVEIRTQREILATLDAGGALDGLPFMPEMAKYCGRRYRVFRRADKAYLDMRYYTVRLTGTVLLEGVRCDGGAHAGCQMRCLMLWKEAWLKAADGPADAGPPPQDDRSLVQVELPTTKGDQFYCQPVAVGQFSRRIAWWDVRQYVRDYADRQRSLGELLRMGWILSIGKIRRRLGMSLLDRLKVNQTRTPQVSLNLQPGELVQVKSREEIEATLDPLGRNRGLGFAGDMLRFCGGTYRVAGRVEKAIIEWSGQMRPIRDTVALEGVTCSGIAQRCCPRDCFHLWREVWLKRVEASVGAGPSVGPS